MRCFFGFHSIAIMKRPPHLAYCRRCDWPLAGTSYQHGPVQSTKVPITEAGKTADD